MRKRIVIVLLSILFMAPNFPAAESTFIDYCWTEVEILKALQNKSGFSFKNQ
jgi:hypothetical protein